VPISFIPATLETISSSIRYYIGKDQLTLDFQYLGQWSSYFSNKVVIPTLDYAKADQGMLKINLWIEHIFIIHTF